MDVPERGLPEGSGFCVNPKKYISGFTDYVIKHRVSKRS